MFLHRLLYAGHNKGDNTQNLSLYEQWPSDCQSMSDVNQYNILLVTMPDI